MIKKIIMGFVFLVLINGVWGEVEGKGGGEMEEEIGWGVGGEIGLEQGMEEVAKEVVGQELPRPFKMLFGDERINIHIQRKSGGEEVWGLVTKEGKVESFSLGEAEDNSLKVEVWELTLEEIQQAEEPGLALKKAWEEGKITYEAKGFWNKIKFGVLGTIAKIVGKFGEEETKGAEEKETEEKGVEDKETEEGGAEETGGGEETEMGEEETVEEEMVEESEETEEGMEEETVEEGTGGITGAVVQAPETRENFPETHMVELIDGGFGVEKITIKAGDKVVWENVRENKKMNKALIVGAQKCARVKSGIFMPGQHFSWTFEEAGTCLIVDGIFTTEVMKVVVEEQK